MEAQIIALILVIPVIFFPAAFIWYLNVRGLFHVLREARQRARARMPHESEASSTGMFIPVASAEAVATRIKSEAEIACYKMGG